MTSSDKLSIKGFKFGIELEFEVDPWDFEEDNPLDSPLLSGWRFHEEHCGTEVVSPPLTGYKGLFVVRRALREIWKLYSAMSFDDCGFHVHVDIQHFRLKHAKRLLSICSIFDDAIFALVGPSRDDNEYVRHCNYDLDDIKTSKDLWDLLKLQNAGRYHGINLHAFTKHGTAEFRYAGGTLDWCVIYSLIAMYLRLIAYAGTDLPIPEEYAKIADWKSAGVSFQDKEAKKLLALKNQFFNMLQISGSVRTILDKLFDKNSRESEPTGNIEYSRPIRGLRKIKL